MIHVYLKKLKKSGIERKIPNISEQNGDFIVKILQEKNPQNILEIGTANGYSALYFQTHLTPALSFKERENYKENILEKIPSLLGEGKEERQRREGGGVNIFTIEYAWNAHNEAVEHFKNCKIKNIFPIWGDAKKIIPAFADNFFDVIYIDAMKKEYLDYLLLSLSKAKNDAIFIIDDVEKFAHKMQDFYNFLYEKNISYTLHKTDIDDSIMIIERKNISL